MQPVSERPSRALVLGGGGSLGRAMHWGLTAGFLEAGIDLRDADLIIGTSAGAVVGAQLGLGADPRLSAPVVDASSMSTSTPSPSARAALAYLIAGCARAAVSSTPEEEWRAIGQMALAVETVSEGVALSRASLAAITGGQWPANFRATAVNAYTGRFQLWSLESDVSLERAVASSSALPGVWPPITIADARYIDGGVRSMLNADLAAGFGRVLVLSCFDLSLPAGAPHPTRVLNQALGREIEQLRHGGSVVEVITPDEAFLTLSGHGTRMLDGSLVPEAYDIAKQLAAHNIDRIRELWCV
jgi:NTE family protein